MGTVRAKESQNADILRLEAEINNLWGELNTANISNAIRQEVEHKLTRCEEYFMSVLAGQSSVKDLAKNLHNCDMELALAIINQAENEIPKREHTSSSFLALENIRHELSEGNLTPIKARHEVKGVMREHRI